MLLSHCINAVARAVIIFFLGGGAKRAPKALDWVWGYRVIIYSRVSEMQFQALFSEILQNAEDYKVHQRHDISTDISPWN